MKLVNACLPSWAPPRPTNLLSSSCTKTSKPKRCAAASRTPSRHVCVIATLLSYSHFYTTYAWAFFEWRLAASAQDADSWQQNQLQPRRQHFHYSSERAALSFFASFVYTCDWVSNSALRFNSSCRFTHSPSHLYDTLNIIRPYRRLPLYKL